MPQRLHHPADQDLADSIESHDTRTQYGHIEQAQTTPFTTLDPPTNTGMTDSLCLPDGPMFSPLYPHSPSFFNYNEAGTDPAGSLLVTSSGVQFANTTTAGDMNWAQTNTCCPGNTTGSTMDADMPLSSSFLPNASMPFAWGMSNFEPMVTTAWDMAGSPAFACVDGTTSAGTSSQHSFARTSCSSNRRPSLSRRDSSITTPQRSPPGSSTNNNNSNNSSSNSSNISHQGPEVKYNTMPQPQQQPPQPQPQTQPQQSHLSQASLPPPRPQPPPSPNNNNSQQQQQDMIPTSQTLRERNRVAANKCRRKSKAVVADLEATERELAAEHESLSQAANALREEVLMLKNALLVHGHCDDEVIQRYLENSARMVGSGESSGARRNNFL